MGRAVPGRTRYGARARTRTIRSKIQRVASSATERDQLICVDLYEHRFLTTNQLFELHFASLQRTRARLLQLYDMGVLWRNRPRAHLGSLPWHYTLDEIGAWIVAEHLGIELRQVGYRDDRKRLAEALARQLLGTLVDDVVGNLIMAQLLHLESEDPEKDINLYINSPGGIMTTLFAIYDTVQYIKPDVSTIVMGQAASAAAVLSLAGTKGLGAYMNPRWPE